MRLRTALVVSTMATCSIAYTQTAQAQPSVRRLAIVVGANEPAPGRQPLRYAHADAQRVADTLVRVGRFAPGDVQTLLDPHPGDILAAVERAGKSLPSGDSLLVFYYSGHSDGQSVFPHGETLALADVRDRLAKSGARIKVGILDTCRGGSWTRAKGLTVGPALDPVDLVNVTTEGTALLSSSSGFENAHEADVVKGSFFTHHLMAGLLGAADTSRDGLVTLQRYSTTPRSAPCATARASRRPRSTRASTCRCADGRTWSSRISARPRARWTSRRPSRSR